MRDNIQRSKRLREEINWSPEASQELLRLRFQTLRTLFDEAQTVADVHEAWGVVASRLNVVEELEVDAVKCTDQLTRLRQQWQDSTQLHLMMTECFSPQQQGRTMPAKSDFNRAMEEVMVLEEKAPKKKKTQETEETSIPTDASLSPEIETPLSRDPAPVSPQSTSPTQQEVPLTDQPEASDIAPVSSESIASTPQEPTPSADPNVEEEEDFPRQDEIMRALEKRSEQLERLAQSHQRLADVTQELMEALVNKHNRTL